MEVFAIPYETHFGGKRLRNTKQLSVCRLLISGFVFDLPLSLIQWVMHGVQLWSSFRRLSQSMFITRLGRGEVTLGGPWWLRHSFPVVHSCTGCLGPGLKLTSVSQTSAPVRVTNASGLSESAVVKNSFLTFLFLLFSPLLPSSSLPSPPLPSPSLLFQ